MRRPPVLLTAIAASLAIAAPALAAGPAGSLTQPAGTAGCITEDGSSNAVAGQCADGRGLTGDEPVVVSPDGRFAYTWGQGGAMGILSRVPASGLLSQADDTSGCLAHNGFGGLCTDTRFPGGSPDSTHSIAISPDGAFVFVAGHGVGAFRRDVSTGALTAIAGTAGCVSSDGTDADGSEIGRASCRERV